MRILNTADYVSEEDLNTLSSADRESMYNGLDCAVTLELLFILDKELDEMTREIYQRSLDLRAPIMEMSMRGILVDQSRRRSIIARFTVKRDRLREQFNTILKEGLGIELSWRSPDQMKKLFYEVLGLKPIRKKNNKGQFVPTVDRSALERLQVHFWAQPLILHLLALRDIQKKIDFLNTGIDPDGRMRATFNIAGTNTGRLASSESEFGTGTNQQNIDRSLRSVFIPDRGYKFINIDLEQGDSRNLGATCWDTFYDEHGATFAGSYLDACESGDLHTMVAKMTWQDLAWPAEGSPAKAFKEVAKQIYYRQDSYRQMAKKLGHGTNFCGQPPTMASHTKVPVNIIADFQNRYFEAFPCIPAYHAWVREQIREYSFLVTLHKRRRYFFGRAEDPKTINEAVAFSPQSMTADAVNKGMIQLWRAIRVEERKEFRDLHILCQVHDSLLLQAPVEIADDIVPAILEVTRVPLRLRGDREFCVPNDAKVGFNWGDVPEDEVKPEDRNDLGLLAWSPNGDKRSPVRKPLTLIGH